MADWRIGKQSLMTSARRVGGDLELTQESEKPLLLVPMPQKRAATETPVESHHALPPCCLRIWLPLHFCLPSLTVPLVSGSNLKPHRKREFGEM